MPINCIVKGCKSFSNSGFLFPIDRPDLNKKWLAVLEKHQKIPPNYEKRRVCSAHFISTDYLQSRGNRHKLSRKAVPSIFPTDNEDDSDEDESTEVGESSIKSEADTDENTSKSSKPRKAIKIPLAEPESEDEMDSDFEPGEDSEDEVESSDDEESEHMDQVDIMEDESRDVGEGSQHSENNVVLPKVSDSSFSFDDLSLNEAIDSDYEPVTDTQYAVLREKTFKKTDQLVRETSTFESMKEMMKNQASTILRLQEELAELGRLEAEEKSENSNNSSNFEINSTSDVDRNGTSKNSDFSNLDLQLFSISLFYFSPKVYAYLGSIMPYLPPKSVVVDWVKSGHAFTLFPPGVLLKENFILD